MNTTANKIYDQIGIAGQEEITTWESTNEFGLIKPGTKVHKGQALFPRLDIEKEVAELEELFADKLEEREKLGMEQGMEQGIRAFILDHIEEGTPKNIILQKLEKRFSLSPEQAEEYFCRFREG